MTPEAKLLAAMSVTAPTKAATKIRAALRDKESVVGAAKSLGVSRSLLYRLMGVLDISIGTVVR